MQPKQFTSEQIRANQKKAIVVIAAIGVFIFASMAIINNKPKEPNTIIEQQNQPPIKPVEKYTVTERQALIKSFDSVQTEYKIIKPVSTLDDAKNDMHSLGLAYLTIGEIIEQKADSDLIKRYAATEKVLANYQKKMFPKYRKAFAIEAKKLLWEDDCEADVGGEQNETLYLYGNYFLPNRNKKETMDQLDKILKEYRFKTVRFKWLASSSDFTDFNINSESDDIEISVVE